MKRILKFDEYINESINNEYNVGDIVLIREKLTGEITPVKIIEKKTHQYYIVSHKVEGSFFYNKNDEGVKKNSILGYYKKSAELTQPQVVNPQIRPGISGIVPGWNSWNNDIDNSNLTGHM